MVLLVGFSGENIDLRRFAASRIIVLCVISRASQYPFEKEEEGYFTEGRHACVGQGGGMKRCIKSINSWAWEATTQDLRSCGRQGGMIYEG
jgi:hypothetical protein